ncbi:MAG: carboxypeptidase-like regulatory domain-containing protein [Myxococcota bacterium]
MNRTVWLGALAALALVALTVGLLGGRATRSGAVAAQGGRSGPNAVAARGGGGVREAEADVDGSAQVRGEVVDEDGVALTEGALLLRCLRGDDVSVLGTVRISPEGTFEGPGCRGRVCATLQHPTQSPAEPWMLQPGAETVLRATSLHRLWGVVEAPDGTPVEAATVTFTAAGPADERDPHALIPLSTRSTTTDADGRFSVAWLRKPPCGPCEEAVGGCAELPPMVDRIEAVASASRYASGSFAWDVDEAVGEGPDTPLRIAMGAAGDLLTGQLVDAQGQAYARAYVLARSIDRPREQRRADVDAQGNFEVDGLGAGEYGVRAIADGVELATADAVAGDDVSLMGEPAAGRGALEVSVWGPEGRLAVGATVTGGPFRGAKTDMKGRVRAERPLPGSMTLRVRLGPDVVRRSVEIPADLAETTAHPHRVEVRFTNAASE